MSLIKSFSVERGDTFYIKHNSSNFTTIDCFLSDENKQSITDEIKEESRHKTITRFISTHPDDDHIRGLEYFETTVGVTNFYCVKNETTKSEQTDSFDKYCELRDSSKAFHIFKGCGRKWMNQNGEDNNGNEIGSSGIFILWPEISNQYYKDALQAAKDGESPNNISPIVVYSLHNGITAIWMGDLENAFMENILDEVDFPKVNILFAPHHGRKSGRVPREWLEKMDPNIIIMGEAPSLNLDYAAYDGYNKITQNSAKDIVFDCLEGKVDIYVSSASYSVSFLKNNYESNKYGCFYLGTLDV